MQRRKWVAAALLLSACAPPGYVYDDGDLLHPHPSAELCASRHLQLDPVAKDCVMPQLALPQRVRPRATAGAAPPSVTAPSAPAPPKAEAVDVRIEPNATVGSDLRANTKLLRELVRFVRENNHPCATISALQTDAATRGFKLACDKSSHSYDIEASGNRFIVTTPPH
jgi:hypothetical protein